jgi:hypothetical protein
MYIVVSILPLSTIFRWNFFIVPKGGICFYQFHPLFPCLLRGQRGRDRMVVGFTTTRPFSKVGVRTPFMARCNRYNIMWYSLSVTCGRSVDFCLYSTNKTDSNDITDILLKMALNTINQTKQNLACHNIIDITKISQLYYYLGYTIRYIMLKVNFHFNTQRLTCNSRRWLEHDKNQYALCQLMGFQPFPLYWISSICTDINIQDRVAQTSLKYKSHLNNKF